MRHSRHAFSVLAIAIVFSLVSFASGSPSIFDEDYQPPKRSQPVDVPPITPRATTTQPTANPPAPAKIDPVPKVDPAPKPAAPVPVVRGRKPVPAAADQAKSRKLMRDIFADQLADRSAAGRKKLAADLLAESKRAADNATDQFVLLGGAIEAGRESASLNTALQAADEMDRNFQIDALALKTDLLARTNLAAIGPPTAVADVVQMGLGMADQLSAGEDYAAATRLCNALLTAAGNNMPLRTAIAARMRDIAANRAIAERVPQSLERLKTAGDDAAANEAIGDYLCCIRNDWQRGLQYLAVSTNPLTKAAATADLATPTGSEAQESVADAWYAAAEKEPPGPMQNAMRQRSAFWYRASLTSGQLTGLHRTRVEKRVASLPAPDAAMAAANPPAVPAPATPIAGAPPANPAPAAPVVPALPQVPPAPARKETLAEVKLESGGEWKKLEQGARVTKDAESDWTEIPADLAGRSYVCNSNHYMGKITFTVTHGGTLYMACTNNWSGGGSAGPWKQELSTRADLEKQGWKEVSTLVATAKGKPWHWIVFARQCKEGETFTIRTEKYTAPALIR